MGEQVAVFEWATLCEVSYRTIQKQRFDFYGRLDGQRANWNRYHKFIDGEQVTVFEQTERKLHHIIQNSNLIFMTE